MYTSITLVVVLSIWQGVSETSAVIVVVANIHLNPSTVYLLPDTSVHYIVELVKHGHMHGML